MLRLAKIALLPVRYIWVLGLLVGLGAVVGLVRIPGVTAQQIECSGQVVEGECPAGETEDEVDVCWNLPKAQASLPRGYHFDQQNDNACVEDLSTPEVLGESTTSPHVLAETDGGSFGK